MKHTVKSTQVNICLRIVLFKSDLKKGETASPLLLHFALEYDVRKVQEKQLELKLNRTYQFLAYADDVNLLGDNIDTINKDTKTLIVASKEVGLELNAEKLIIYCCIVTRMRRILIRIRSEGKLIGV
jgi:hypothetical protein